MMKNLTVVAILLLLFNGCDAHREPLFVRTGDGRQFPVKGLGQVILGGNLTHPKILQLQYVTNTKIEDSPALRSEALAVFYAWPPQLEKDGIRYAVVGATAPPGANGASQLRNFVFERDAGGPWHSRLLGNERPDRD